MSEDVGAAAVNREDGSFDTRLLPVLMDGPQDVRRLRELLDRGEVAAEDIQGINISHEGDMFARALTSDAFAGLLAERLGVSVDDVKATVPIQAIAGMAGFMVPHAVVVLRRAVARPANGSKRLIAACGCTRAMEPDEVGTLTHVRLVRDEVARLIGEAYIDDPSDVHFVFVKGPSPIGARRFEAERQGKSLVSDDDRTVGMFSRGAAALGSAIALGEVSEAQVEESGVLGNLAELYSRVTHCSSGGERVSNGIILLGNSSRSSSDYVIGHGMMQDSLDTNGVKDVLRTMKFDFDCCPSETDRARIEYAFVKSKSTDEVPTIRGHRHTLKSDAVLGPFAWKVEKAPVHATVASVLGTPVFEVATGSSHQGPWGCPLVAVIARAAA